MKIGIISDTHGSRESWEDALDLFAGCELIFHAGDVLYHGPRNPLPGGYDPRGLAARINDCPVPVFIARGNCDADVDDLLLNLPLLSPYFYACLDGIKFLMLHGTDRSEAELAELGRRFHSDVVVFGHIHTPVARRDGELTLFNPGSPSLPKNERATVGLLDTELRTLQVLAADGSGLLEEVAF